MPDTDLQPPFEAHTGNDPYVFVSYAHKDGVVVFPEIDNLHSRGYRIWYDEGIDPGNEWPEEVAEALAKATLFMVFISPNAVDSRNVRSEINFAINRRKPFIAVHITETQLPLGLELIIGDIQAILKYRMKPELYLRKLLKTLPAKVRGSKPGQEAPPRSSIYPTGHPAATQVRGLKPAHIFKSTVSAETLNDDFNGTIANSDRWHIPTWKGSGDGTFVGRTQFRCVPVPLPKAENSNGKILLETYNPTANNPGDSFFGTDLISKQLFSSGKGIRLKVRAKMNTSQRGIVGGIFLYVLKSGSNTLHDEIDFELITNIPDKVQTNIYSNEQLGEGNPVLLSYISGSITDYHTYEIQWQPNRVSWFVDGSLLRTETENVPTGPMYFHLNIWAPAEEWELAYDPDFQPVGDPKENQELWMSVDSVSLQSFTPAPV